MKRIIIASVVIASVLFASPAYAASKPSSKAGVSASVYKKLPPCPFDEVTELDCYWNAKKQGNGTGRSFVVIGGTLYYVR